ncbi:MAG: DUF2231 domain-containing protein [Acidimicrobiales bacterium]
MTDPLLARLPNAVARQSWLDPAASWMAARANRALHSPKFLALAQGKWLGHPVHPALTDLPIGFWTSAFMLDIAGGHRAAPAARRLIGWGNLSAVPTAIAGFADAKELGHDDRRIAVTHAALNIGGLAAYVVSYFARRGPGRKAAIASSFIGAALLTVSAHLGGHLALGSTEADAEF